MRTIILAAIAATLIPVTAHAAPGLGDEVYGATVNPGELETEVRYDTLTGGPDDGEDVVKLEAAYGVSHNLRVGMVTEFEREPGDSRKAEALGIEAIWALGKVGGIDLAVYGEYEFGFTGPDKIETKLLLERRSGPVDLRLNLVAEKPLVSGAKVELSYAASADIETIGEFRLGVQAFGDLGTFDRFAPYGEHFVGPVISTEIEGFGPDLELQAGYLFAVGKSRDDTKGQLRFALEAEF
ncbi:hypothetical protein [Novosphingobium sp.]|uniref:hypothetical protein n=1 Tax=Novosphingobium sp. TaxID=1874826 RepID=UPI0035B22C94